MFQQLLSCCLFCKYPVIQFKSTELITKVSFKTFFLCTIIKNLLRHEVTKKFFHIIISTFTRKKLSRRNIQETYTTCTFTKMNSSKEIVFFIIEHIVPHGHTWCHKFCDTTLHHLIHLAQTLFSFYHLTLLLRVFQLVTDGNTFTCTYQFRQIGIKCVMWESSHLSTTRTTSVITPCQGNTKNSTSFYGILTICFIKISTTKKHQSIRMLRLHTEELFHHWG